MVTATGVPPGTPWTLVVPGALVMRFQSAVPGHSVVALTPESSEKPTALHSQPLPSAVRRTERPVPHVGTTGTFAASTLTAPAESTLIPSPAAGDFPELHAANASRTNVFLMDDPFGASLDPQRDAGAPRRPNCQLCHCVWAPLSHAIAARRVPLAADGSLTLTIAAHLRFALAELADSEPRLKRAEIPSATWAGPRRKQESHR